MTTNDLFAYRGPIAWLSAHENHLESNNRNKNSAFFGAIFCFDLSPTFLTTQVIWGSLLKANLAKRNRA
ncbi:hypothetical protein, partial [Vibrio cholerae]|uniref:hypothetical protein n=1 Tax=Vibrio cholerae TaxID=666 RepID=UPI001964B480